MKTIKFALRYLRNAGQVIFGLRFMDPPLLRPHDPDHRISYSNFKKQRDCYYPKFNKFIKTLQITPFGEGRKIGFLWFCTGTPKEIRMSIFWGMLMEHLGFDVYWIVCDGAPIHCVSNQFKDYRAINCKSCSRKMKQVLNIYNQKHIPLQKPNEFAHFDSSLDLSEILNFRFEKFEAGVAAFYSSLKYTKNDFKIEDNDLDYIYSALKGYINTYKAVKKTMIANDIDILFTHGGQYANYRAALNASLDIEKDCICYENFGVNKIILSKNTSCFNMPVDQVPIQHNNVTIKKGREIVDGIRTGKYYGRVFNITSSTPEEIDLDDYLLIVPNVSWDSATWYFESKIYKNQYKWLFDTIIFCSKNKIDFVIRCHPGERLMASKYTLYSIIMDFILDNKIDIGDSKIFSHEDTLSTYDLMRKARKAVLNVSTMGLEMPHYNIPAIIIGTPYYKDKGFNWYPQNRDDYYNLLISDLSVSDDQKNKLYEYMCYLDNYRIHMNYGDFFRFTGRDEFKIHGIDKKEYEGIFPFEDMDIEKFLGFFLSNFNTP